MPASLLGILYTACREADKASSRQLSHNAMESAGSFSRNVVQRNTGYLECAQITGLGNDNHSPSWGKSLFPGTEILTPLRPWALPQLLSSLPMGKNTDVTVSLSFQQSLWSFQVAWFLTVQGKLRKGVMQNAFYKTRRNKQWVRP